MTYTGDVTVGGPADTRELGGLTISKLAVGPMDNNAYLLVDRSTGEGLLVDAANEADRLIELAGDTPLATIVTTHRHGDHWQALAEVVDRTGARTVAHELDAPELPVPVTETVGHGDTVSVGASGLTVVHLRGHTPGSIALAYTDPQDGVVHLFTGDSLFPGGPGRTTRPDRLRIPYGRPGVASVRPVPGQHLGLPGARQGHHARQGASLDPGVARAGMVTAGTA